jgi:hypothetical protein
MTVQTGGGVKMSTRVKRHLLFLASLSLFIGVSGFLDTNFALAQGTIEKTGSLTGGHSDSVPVPLSLGDVLQVNVKSADQSIAIGISDPGGNQVQSSRTAAGGVISYQARINGQHAIVVSNTNGMDVYPRAYALSYSVLPARNAPPLNPASNSASGSLTGGHSYSTAVQLSQGQVLQVTIATMDQPLSMAVDGPTGKIVLSATTVGTFLYQAEATGTYSVAVNNANGFDVFPRAYDIAYRVVPASALPALPRKTPAPAGTPPSAAAAPGAQVADRGPTTPLGDLFLIGLLILIAIIVLVFVVLRMRRGPRYYDQQSGGNTYIFVNGKPKPPQSDIGRGARWHIPKVNRKGVDFIIGSSRRRR